MTKLQREQNPDVNSYNPNAEPTGDSDVEREKGSDEIPVPPDARPGAPIEEPPSSEGVPVGDVDDSPKQIA